MDSHQTLHDFVLDLLTNPDARSAFDLDPEGALRGAGLTDITAADVQDVVPLVVDYAPGAGIAPLGSPVEQLGLDPLLTDTTDVVGQLQSVAQQISITSSPSGVDVKAGVLGAIAVDPSTAAAGVTVLPGIGLGVGPYGLDTDLAGVSDVAHTLDADVVQPVDAIADPVLGDVTGAVGDPGGLLGGVTDPNLIGGDLTGGVLSGTHGQIGGVVSSLGVDDTLSGLGLGHGDGVVGGVVPPLDVPSTVGGVTHQVDSLLPGVTDTVGDVTGGATDGVLGGDSHASSDHGLLGLTGGLL
ncbi:IniB N-terminal domain-containing protein [Micromonospora sp. NPDC049645]|uniref:IniB N-terminal domain-containing protein n=1 Tax=Micromonospora sp. NPDC049645 TaxID=3155508 RepID=UPI003426CD2A